jgi:hypothetical protein
MPFTFSHPAASVPLARRGLVLSALVVGSMAPDFAYFVPWLPGSRFSHRPFGALLFCVPTGLLVLWAFHTIMKRPLLSLLPDNHQRRLIPAAKGFAFGPLRQFILIILSLILGALTHIGWDACTHSHSWVVRHVPVLSMPIIETAQGSLRVYKALQHGSTLVGAVLLCYWYARWYSQAPARPATLPIQLSTTAKLSIVLSIGLGASVLAGVHGFINVFPISDFHSFQLFVVRTVVAGISVLFAELVIFSTFWHLTKSKRRAHLV